MPERTWESESKVRLDSLMVAYYLALRGLPIVGAKIKLPHAKRAIVFPTTASISQVKKEISNAFYLRLKSLVESRLKYGSVKKVKWEDEASFLKSLDLNPLVFNEDEKRLFSHFSKLRNALAHDYGFVDEYTKAKLPELKGVSYIEMDEEVMRNWFIFADRIFALVGAQRSRVVT
jgi:hypothetical protein